MKYAFKAMKKSIDIFLPDMDNQGKAAVVTKEQIAKL
jgi:hypothetical protein